MSRENCICCGGEFVAPEKFTPLDFCERCDFATQGFHIPFHYPKYYHERYEKNPERELSYLRVSVLSKFIGKNQSVLDYGGGSFAFRDFARECGFSIDSFNAHEEQPKRTYDCVTLYDVLEHLPDPRGIFELSPQFFIVSVPDFSAVTSGKEELKKWRHYKPDEHVHYFSFTALRRLFHNAGFVCVYESHIEDYIRKATFANILTCVFERAKS